MIARLHDLALRLARGQGAGTVLVVVLVALATAAAASLAVGNFALLTHVDRLVSDWETAALLPRESQDSDIVVVAITEDTLRQFPYRSPVDRAFLSDLLETLAQRGPRAIGLDVLFDQPTEPEKDERLKRTLRELPVPLVVSYSDSEAIVNETQRAFLNDFVPPSLRGYATLAEDQFDTVHWTFPGQVNRDGIDIPSLSRGLAAKTGVATPERLIEIAWHGQPDRRTPAFRQYPAHLVKRLPAAFFKNKVVLIGADLTLTDRHRTPFSTVFAGGEGMLPGIVIQAHSLSQLLQRKPAPFASWQSNALLALIAAALGAALGVVAMPLAARIGIAVAAVLLLWGGGGALFHYGGTLIGVVAPTLALAASLWAMDVFTGRQARKQREFIQGAFSTYVSPKVVEQLIRDPSKMSLDGERRIMTFLFTDVADFTTMSEKVESRELARVLNAYLDGVTQIVLKHDGMVDKFIGDAVFAIFNAPVDQPDHAEAAVRCALDIDRFSEIFRAEQNPKGIPFGITRVGINTGPAVIGNFGSRSRFSYTATGDAVNTAARLEGLNKYLGTRICVAESTRELCTGIPFRPIADVVVKGKATAVSVWEPLQDDDPRTEFIRRYIDAFAKLKSEAPDALAALTALGAEDPADPCVSLHLSRLSHGERGVEMVMTDK